MTRFDPKNALYFLPEPDAAIEDVDLDSLFTDMPDFFVDAAEFLGVDMNSMAAKYSELKVNGLEQAKAQISKPAEIAISIVQKLLVYLGYFPAAAGISIRSAIPAPTAYKVLSEATSALGRII